MLKRNLSKIAVIISMLSLLAPISAFADTTNNNGVYDGDGTYLGTTEYDFTLTPVNTETATKDGSSKIKIIKGDATSINLTGKGSNTGFGSYTTDVARFAKGLGGWLTVTLTSNGYGNFTAPVGWKEQDGYLCAVVLKGTTSIPTSNTNQIEFTDDVVFKFKVNFTEHNDDYSVGDVTGWNKDGDYWYYTSSDDTDAVGWNQIDGKWYYFYSDGKMASNTYISSYYVDSNGVWVQ